MKLRACEEDACLYSADMQHNVKDRLTAATFISTVSTKCHSFPKQQLKLFVYPYFKNSITGQLR
jgi:hypothetical protein